MRPIRDIMARKLLNTIFQEVAEAPDRTERIRVLQANNNTAFKDLLRYGLDPNIQFDVKIPTYRQSEETDGYAANTLYVEYRRLYMFTSTFTKINAVRKAALLCQILESIDISDALLLIKVVKKELQPYGLDVSIVNEAFPGLIQ